MPLLTLIAVIVLAVSPALATRRSVDSLDMCVLARSTAGGVQLELSPEQRAEAVRQLTSPDEEVALCAAMVARQDTSGIEQDLRPQLLRPDPERYRWVPGPDMDPALAHKLDWLSLGPVEQVLAQGHEGPVSDRWMAARRADGRTPEGCAFLREALFDPRDEVYVVAKLGLLYGCGIGYETGLKLLKRPEPDRRDEALRRLDEGLPPSIRVPALVARCKLQDLGGERYARFSCRRVMAWPALLRTPRMHRLIHEFRQVARKDPDPHIREMATSLLDVEQLGPTWRERRYFEGILRGPHGPPDG